MLVPTVLASLDRDANRWIHLQISRICNAQSKRCRSVHGLFSLSGQGFDVNGPNQITVLSI